jgi:uncharacterized integral membrane protein
MVGHTTGRDARPLATGKGDDSAMSDEKPIRSTQDEFAITGDQVKRYGPIALLALAALLFVLQNTESVNLEFLWFNFEWPLWIMLVGFAGVGALVFYGIQRRRRARGRTRNEPTGG